mgnify:CR=1 FL=1
MKNIVVATVVLAFVLVSCNQKNKQDETHNHSETMEVSEKKYACPMHPEVTGKKGDSCSKCGMDLTEEVK